MRHDVSPGRERSFRTHLLSLRRQRRLHRRPLRPLRGRPELGRCRVAGLLRQPEGRRRRRSKSARGAVVEAAALADRRATTTALGARRPMGRGREDRSATRSRAKAQDARRRAFVRRRAAGDARFGPRADADPRLSHPRPPPRQSRSARARAAQGRRGARSALLRLHRGRLRPQDLPRQGARARIRHPARDRRDPAAHLLPDARRRVHAHLRRRPEGLDPGAHRGARQGDQLHARRQARDPQQAGRGRRLREVLRHQIHRHQALRPRRRRVADPGARADHQARRQARREGDRARHGASRPAERAHPGDGQAAPRDVPRVQGRLGRRPTTSKARAT